MRLMTIVLGLVICLCGCGYGNGVPLTVQDLIPSDEQISPWALLGSPIHITDEEGLYLQLDGAASKYIERGWVECVIMLYMHQSYSLGIAIHDMADYENAAAILEYDTPISHTVLWDSSDSTALLDTGLPNGYAVQMRLLRFYVELRLDWKDQETEQLITDVAELMRYGK